MTVNQDEFREVLAQARKLQKKSYYNAAENEKIRKKAASIFMRYEDEMTKKMAEQQKEYIREHYLYS